MLSVCSASLQEFNSQSTQWVTSSSSFRKIKDRSTYTECGWQSRLVRIGSVQQRKWVWIKRFMLEKHKDNNSGCGIDFLFRGLVGRPHYTVETLQRCRMPTRFVPFRDTF
ncbi:hypothetical protein MRB53_036719 [Persea americana]|nr:hypothetical protein MRB53_036719 [Persea americana]